MSQPANKRTPLGIDAFSYKPTPDPSLIWEKWRFQYELSVLSKENIIFDTLLGSKAKMIEFLLELLYEETIVGSSAQFERERNARNAQQEVNLQNKCQKLIEKGITCGDKPWPLADSKNSFTTLLMYWCRGTQVPHWQKFSYNDWHHNDGRVLENRSRCVHQTKKHHFWRTRFPNHEATRRNWWTLLRKTHTRKLLKFLRKTQKTCQNLRFREKRRKLDQIWVHNQLNWSRGSKGALQTKCRVETSVGTSNQNGTRNSQSTLNPTTQQDPLPG